MSVSRCVFFLVTVFIFYSCKNKSKTGALFTLMSPGETGIHFQNRITDTDTLNIIEYLYYYNGGGVAIGDINNDGLVDIYFSSNLESNKLYLNKGNFKFEDITESAGVQGSGNWKTGVTITDVNGDGLPDIYVCEVGNYKNLRGRNELFINTTNPVDGKIRFVESAEKYGLAIEGFNTQSVFFDYDRDGDLDMFLVNHSVHSTDTYVNASARLVKNEASGDKLFQNNGNHFTEVTISANIYSSIVGYGLNAVAGDLNNDGWEDIYVSNDFHENDYYYINQHDGTFKEMNATAFGHESRFSMGSDMADLNNDGWLDLLTLDMLPPDEKVLKTSAGEDPLDIFNYKLSYGYHYQFARNCLQLNNGGGNSFSDIALYAGVAATDWSWSPLAADFNNDGIKDLFITNGILRRPNDLDYLKFVSTNYYGSVKPAVSELEAIRKMPDGKVSNYIFKGTDSIKYQDMTVDWGLEKPGYSNGAAYADLDNDGDLDLVVNNINEPALIYQNNTITGTNNHYLQVKIIGYGNNPFGIGTKVILKHGKQMQLGMMSTTRGFQSSSLQPVHFGTGNNTVIDTLQVFWPDGSVKTIIGVKTDQNIIVTHSPANSQPSLLPSADNQPTPLFVDITDSIRLPFTHHENNFNDFNSESFIPHQVSTQGPKIAVADLNHDGLDDFFICGAAGQSGKLFIQNKLGKFEDTNAAVFSADSSREETNALFFDATGDGHADLYVLTGGNQFGANHSLLSDCLYTNDGKGNFRKSRDLPPIVGNKSVAVSSDFDRDGDMDLFVGGRVVTGQYGIAPASGLLINDGSGKFTIARDKTAPGLRNIGMVTGAVWIDLERDGYEELVIVGEWMPVTVFKNKKGQLENSTSALNLQTTTGLWATITKTDMDGDGYDDLLAGNRGENSKLRASINYPLRIYVGDIDGNGSVDQLLNMENRKKYYLFLDKEEIEKHLPGLIKKKYLSYASMAGLSPTEIFGEKLKEMQLLSATNLSSLLIMNTKGTLSPSRLPYHFQWSPVFSFVTDDFNGDNKMDVISGGNFFGVTPYEGKYDAAAFNIMLSSKDGYINGGQKSGLTIKGEIRDIKKLRSINKQTIYVVARNNNSCIFFKKYG